jgi:UDP-glucuronate 4-epimerase|tara:strand:+ start:12559 stop:13563 length:1005 start_codon:yes stop_codon:yes gene_type:complete
MKPIEKILVTGNAGFIGFHLSKKLLEKGYKIIGLDNVNDYYDVGIKKDRLKILKNSKNFIFFKVNLSSEKKIDEIFKKHKPKYVVNLAAQAGVRYSFTNPEAYIESNLQGFFNILNSCKNNKVKHFIYASSSSVYGLNKDFPFSENQNVDHPVSLYAATKKSNELIAHSYSHLFNLPTTGLRFFTVYGPWGRPDMSLFLFVDRIMKNKKIKVFGNGRMLRDFTYIDDIVESIIKLIKLPPEKSKNISPSSSIAPWKVFNIGNNSPVTLKEYIQIIEKKIGKKAEKVYLPMQPGDVRATAADTKLLHKYIGFKPSTKLEDGIESFVEWYKGYYKV